MATPHRRRALGLLAGLVVVASCWVVASCTAGTSGNADAAQAGDAPDGGGGPEVTQWSVHDLFFVAQAPHAWNDFPLQVTFTHSASGTQLTLDGFWDGGDTFAVRYALPLVGAWTWQTFSSDPGLAGSGSLSCVAPSALVVAGNPSYRGHVRVAADGRHFEHADGTPFFYLGDTNWNLMLSDWPAVGAPLCDLGGNFERWANDRRAKGFTVLQGRYFELGAQNEGGYPFPGNTDDNGDWSSLSPGFFQSADIRMQHLFDRGFVVAAHPDWIIQKNATLAEVEDISRYLLARYGAFGIVWSLTGEFQAASDAGHPEWAAFDWAKLRELGAFVSAHNPYGHPLSVHPGGWDPDAPTFGEQSSAHFFHADGWLDHHWLQTYVHVEKVAYRVREAYDYVPAKPVIESEPCYEGYAGSCFEETARFQAWTALLNGAGGHVYGAEGLYYCDDMAALDRPGAGQMRHVADFFGQIEWWRLLPDVNCVTKNGSAPDLLSTNDPSCAAVIAELYVVYVPAGSASDTIELRNLANRTYLAQWFDPRSGAYADINGGTPVNGDLDDRWILPPRPDGEDWVCLLRAGP